MNQPQSRNERKTDDLPLPAEVWVVCVQHDHGTMGADFVTSHRHMAMEHAADFDPEYAKEFGPVRVARYVLADSAPSETKPLKADQVEWVVNDIAELGVKIGDRFFWLYKGRSLVYGAWKDDNEQLADGIVKHDDGKPMYWRPVFKREFGECCHPLNLNEPEKFGTVSLDDSDEWKTLPALPEAERE